MCPNSKKICLNCKGDWDVCHGYECVCLDAVCCDLEISEEEKQKRLLDRQYLAFGYKISD